MAKGDSYETFDSNAGPTYKGGSGSSKLPGAPAPSPVQGGDKGKGK